MRWTAVVNPGAGRRRSRRDLDRLGQDLTRRGVAIRATATVDEGLAVAREAFARGDGVLACGGDGTVRALAGLAAETGGLLGVVPTGSGNDFARELGIDPRHPLAALDLLDTVDEALVDLGRAHTADGTVEWFTTVAHSGLDGEVNRWANTVTWASGTALYVMAALRTMATYDPTPLRVTADGTTWEGRAWLVAVANTHCYGGGMRIAPDADVTDGRLEVCIVGTTSRAELVVKFPRMIRGTHHSIDAVHTLSGASIEIEGGEDHDL